MWSELRRGESRRFRTLEALRGVALFTFEGVLGMMGLDGVSPYRLSDTR
jgi:hypothetical protein